MREENKALMYQLESLQVAARASDIVLTELSEKQDALAEQSRKSLGAMYELRKQNKEIKSYLDTLVPPDVAGVLNSARTRTPGKSIKEVSGDGSGSNGR